MRKPLNQPYTVSMKFGVPTTTAKWGKHAGIDYAAPTGRTVFAPVGGTVTSYTWGEYHGKVVQIKDNKGNYHRLMHNHTLLVKPGDRVKEGKGVALLGATGKGVTGPHVHHDISPQKVPTSYNFLDPNKYNDKQEDNLKSTRKAVYVAHRFYLGRDPKPSEYTKNVDKVDFDKMVSGITNSAEYKGKIKSVGGVGNYVKKFIVDHLPGRLR